MVYFYLLIIVQVVAESLPVSSSGHQKLLELFFEKVSGAFSGGREFMSEGVLGAPDQQSSFFSADAQSTPALSLLNTQAASQAVFDFAAFDYVLHGCTALIIAFYFRNTWVTLFKHLLCCSRRFAGIVTRLVFFTFIADVVTALFFFGIKAWAPAIPLYAGFCVTAILLLSLRKSDGAAWNPDIFEFKDSESFCSRQDRGSQAKFNFLAALALGTVQGLAAVPGVSRFAAVYVASRWWGFDSRRALAVSWMIFFPLMCAATFKGVYTLARTHMLAPLFTPAIFSILFFATLLGYAAFCFAARCAYKNKFWLFGFYVATLALLLFLLSR